jgi:hypothetical protein
MSITLTTADRKLGISDYWGTCVGGGQSHCREAADVNGGSTGCGFLGFGGHKDNCTHFDTNVCKLGDGGSGEPFTGSSSGLGKCGIDATKIVNNDQMTKFRATFGSMNDDFARVYCSLPTNKGCPTDFDGSTPPMCSRLLSSDPMFSECAQLNNRFDAFTDSLKTDFCNKNPDNYNCRCINQKK